MARFKHTVTGAIVSRRDDAPDMPGDWEQIDAPKSRRSTTKSDDKK